MKRSLIIVAVVVLASSLSKPSLAQYGMMGGGGDPIADLQSERAKIKQRLQQYSKPPQPKQHAQSRKLATNPIDPTGRSDLAGRPVPFYPSSRTTGSFYTPRAAVAPRRGSATRSQPQLRTRRPPAPPISSIGRPR